jgi:hypothetical protein
MVFGSERGGEIGKRVLVGMQGKEKERRGWEMCVSGNGRGRREGVGFWLLGGSGEEMGTEWRLCNGSGSITRANITLMILLYVILVSLTLLPYLAL